MRPSLSCRVDRILFCRLLTQSREGQDVADGGRHDAILIDYRRGDPLSQTVAKLVTVQLTVEASLGLTVDAISQHGDIVRLW